MLATFIISSTLRARDTRFDELPPCHRTGPDQSNEDRFRFNQVRVFGPIWEAALTKAWNDSLLDLKEVAQQLGVTPATAKFQAARLGLAFPRPGSWTIPADKYLPHPRRPQGIDPEKLARYRKAWLDARETYPEADTLFLLKFVDTEYKWLRKRDIDWLKAHQPARNTSSPPSSQSRVDWGHRDAQLAKAVEEAALRLKGSPGRPVWITRSAIAREMGRSPMAFLGSLERIPLTQKALTRNQESLEGFAIRKIKWAATLFQQEHISPTKTQLLRRATVWDWMKSPLVQKSFQDALRMLNVEG